MGAIDISKSERAIMVLLYLSVLAALLFTHAPKEHIDAWSLYAGGVVGIYTVAKSITPGARSPAPGTTTSSLKVETTTTDPKAEVLT